MKRIIIYLSALLLLLGTASCEQFLDVKPDLSYATPTDRLENLLYLLDNTSALNLTSNATSVIASDNLYMTPANWQSLSRLTSRNAYVWEQDLFNDNDRNDWTLPYNSVLIANIVLEGTDSRPPAPGEEALWRQVRGAALFYRANAFQMLLQAFAKPYDPATAAADPGIALRLQSDLETSSVRASVQESYDRVLQDLQEAVSLLPDEAAYKTRPTRAAALALLARTLLTMERYAEAEARATEALALHPQLLDYNTLNAAAAYPVPRYNTEVLFHSHISSTPGLLYPTGKVSPELYNQYAPDDLRRTLFFRMVSPTDIGFKGSYYGAAILFSGLATDEVYLIRAECRARLGQPAEALADLNTLLVRRWKAGTYVPYEGLDQEAALALVLQERRKELAFRGLRWGDLRRLNRDPRFALTLTRELGDDTYTLPPNDPRYVFPLPVKVVEASGMAQNP